MVLINRHNYEEYVKAGLITELSKVEKRKYESYHKDNYNEDYNLCVKITSQSSKWSIIIGYYAMHNQTKLFLAKFGLKISDKAAHTATLIALRKIIQDDKIKKKVIELLEKAQQTYDVLNTPFKEKVIGNLLSKSLEERKKAQYYSQDTNKIALLNAMSFQENILKPYIEIINKLIENVD